MYLLYAEGHINTGVTRMLGDKGSWDQRRTCMVFAVLEEASSSLFQHHPLASI